MLNKTKTLYLKGLNGYGEEHEIRTHGSLHYATFPRWCLQPLGQLFNAF